MIDKVINNQYVIGNKIGSETYGDIYDVVNLNDG